MGKQPKSYFSETRIDVLGCLREKIDHGEDCLIIMLMMPQIKDGLSI
jgi:hypothetical protein